MKDNKVTILVLVFSLVCLALLGGIYFMNERLKALQEEYNELEQRRVNLKDARDTLIAQRDVFQNAFKELEGYRVNVAENEMKFYEEVQQAVQNNGVNILSTRQQPVNQERICTIALTLQGDYYNLMQVLAAWRNLPITVRIASFTVRGREQPRGRGNQAQPEPTGRVEADVTVEAVIQ